MKKITFIVFAAIGIGIIATGASRVWDDHQAKYTIILEQQQEINNLFAHLTDQNAQLRIMAYHQAVAQMEQQFPLESRDHIPALEWENMLAERTDRILGQFLEEHGNGKPDGR